MKAFELTKKMLNMGGTFYPTGYGVIMFPGEDEARQAADALDSPDVEIIFLTPEDILRKIAHADGETAVALPSVGTEGETLHKYVNLAREGHHALMIRMENQKKTDLVMAVVREMPYSYAQKYHSMAIEDLE